VKVATLEQYKNQASERQHVKDEIEAFSTQELTKVKHLVWTCLSVRVDAVLMFLGHHCV